MPSCASRRSARPACQAWVWLLLCAVLLQGGAGALVQVLGRAHTHAAVSAAPAAGWLGSLLAWREARLQALQASVVFKHAAVGSAAHHHDGLERHHHEPGDATVQAVDSVSADATADSGPGSAGSAASPWGPTAEYRASPDQQAGAVWPPAPPPVWTSALIRLPERPPRA